MSLRERRCRGSHSRQFSCYRRLHAFAALANHQDLQRNSNKSYAFFLSLQTSETATLRCSGKSILVDTKRTLEKLFSGADPRRRLMRRSAARLRFFSLFLLALQQLSSPKNNQVIGHLPLRVSHSATCRFIGDSLNTITFCLLGVLFGVDLGETWGNCRAVLLGGAGCDEAALDDGGCVGWTA